MNYKYKLLKELENDENEVSKITRLLLENGGEAIWERDKNGNEISLNYMEFSKACNRILFDIEEGVKKKWSKSLKKIGERYI